MGRVCRPYSHYSVILHRLHVLLNGARGVAYSHGAFNIMYRTARTQSNLPTLRRRLRSSMRLH